MNVLGCEELMREFVAYSVTKRVLNIECLKLTLTHIVINAYARY